MSDDPRFRTGPFGPEDIRVKIVEVTTRLSLHGKTIMEEIDTETGERLTVLVIEKSGGIRSRVN